jgi:hypothetical protein
VDFRKFSAFDYPTYSKHYLIYCFGIIILKCQTSLSMVKSIIE